MNGHAKDFKYLLSGSLSDLKAEEMLFDLFSVISDSSFRT